MTSFLDNLGVLPCLVGGVAVGAALATLAQRQCEPKEVPTQAVPTTSAVNKGGQFAGKVAIVTGGAGGIGAGIAAQLKAEGAEVVILDMPGDRLEAAAKSMGVHAIGGNITSADYCNDVAKEVKEKYGRIDILVQSAGITGKTGIKSHDVDEQNFQLVFDINVKGIFLMSKAVLPTMVEQNFGRIVNLASVAGKEGNAGMLAYSASKAAVIGMTKSMGKEYAELGITVNAIAPAVVLTPMVAAMPAQQVKYMTDKIPMKRCGKVSELAALACYIASEEAGFVTGFTFDATGGRATY